ncbi:MAG TPA: SpoIIE family protein phosphatase [Polyangiaceae bacterium]|nr:SpoIIE family protein phosphatase [Polyangiaceae bacterium]
MAWLVALDGGLAGRKFSLDATFLVGRGPFNHVVLDDVRISRQHAKISPEQSGHVVYDLNSANGTFVNDAQIERHRLVPGDLVRFGPFRFRFEPDPTHDPVASERRSRQPEELTRTGFEAPTKIVGEADAQAPQNLIATGGLADLEDADRRLRTLFRFTSAISATLDASALLDRLVESLFEAFPACSVAAIYTLDAETRTMDLRRGRGRDGTEFTMPLPAELYLEVVQRGKALLSAPMTLGDEGPMGSGLMMHAPMIYRGDVLGVLNVRSNPGSGFTQGDLDLLLALASQASLALESARLHQAELAHERLERDLSLAEQIQKSFLPLAMPEVAGVTFVAEYRPAYSIGGDFYDVFTLTDGRIGCVIGDVSGKGVSAALLMARVSSDLRTALLTEKGPAAALSRVNRELVQRGQHDIFVTAVAMILDPDTGEVTLSNAGHMPPYVRHRDLGSYERIDRGASSPLGLFVEIPYEAVSVSLAEGDTLVLSTDGIHEATSERGQQLGFEGFEAALARGTSHPKNLAESILSAVRAHVGQAPQYDDLTLVLCGVGAGTPKSGPPRRSDVG